MSDPLPCPPDFLRSINDLTRLKELLAQPYHPALDRALALLVASEKGNQEAAQATQKEQEANHQEKGAG